MTYSNGKQTVRALRYGIPAPDDSFTVTTKGSGNGRGVLVRQVVFNRALDAGEEKLSRMAT